MAPGDSDSARSVRVTRLTVLTFAVLAVVVTACVWAGVSFSEMFHVVGGR